MTSRIRSNTCENVCVVKTLKAAIVRRESSAATRSHYGRGSVDCPVVFGIGAVRDTLHLADRIAAAIADTGRHDQRIGRVLLERISGRSSAHAWSDPRR